MIEFHMHHLVPKHAGGSDDPSNLLKVNRRMHIFLHELLFKEYGRWQDKAAYKILSGEQSTNRKSKPAATEFGSSYTCNYCAFHVANYMDDKWHRSTCKGDNK